MWTVIMRSYECVYFRSSTPLGGINHSLACLPACPAQCMLGTNHIEGSYSLLCPGPAVGPWPSSKRPPTAAAYREVPAELPGGNRRHPAAAFPDPQKVPGVNLPGEEVPAVSAHAKLCVFRVYGVFQQSISSITCEN